MRLPEAIESGSRLHPRSDRAFYLLDAEGQITASCAIGAALEAVKGSEFCRKLNPHDGKIICGSVVTEARKEFPELSTVVSSKDFCDCPEEAYTLWGMVVHLADQHGFSREKIAGLVSAYQEGKESVRQHELV